MNTVGKNESMLCIDCSTTKGLVGLWHNQKWQWKVLEGNSHSLTIMDEIQCLLFINNIGVNNLSAIAVVNGPGSLTGIRLGCAVAQGLGLAYNIPIVRLHSLVSLGWGYKNCQVVLDARMKRVYVTQVTDNDWLSAEKKSRLVFIKEAEQLVITQEKAKAPTAYVYCGRDDTLNALQGFGAEFSLVEVNSEQLGNYALAKWQSNEYCSVEELQPNYLEQ